MHPSAHSKRLGNTRKVLSKLLRPRARLEGRADVLEQVRRAEEAAGREAVQEHRVALGDVLEVVALPDVPEQLVPS